MATSENSIPQLAQLDGLFGHLSCCSGLYAKETFLSLFSCVTKLIRDHRMKGLVLLRTRQEEPFETMAVALSGLEGVSVHRFETWEGLSASSDMLHQTGFLMVLTDRFSVGLYWSSHTYETFRMYEGGWTFHPADVRTLAHQLATQQQDLSLLRQIEETPIDRRYDEKLNLLITSLVNGLENRNRELTQTVEHVKALNKKMVESERLAAIGQLCSVIAHEIRNPLGLIDLYAKLTQVQLEKLPWESLAGELGSSDVIFKNLSMIRDASQNLETILSELTQYSRPIELQMESTPIGSFLDSLCEFYRPYYDEKHVKLVLQVASADLSTLEISVDQGKIRQAVINLLKNALEVSPENSTVTVVLAHRHHDPNLYIKVTDQGPGVDPNIVQKLFTPYFSTKGQGTGLGLAHSRKILQAHGGTVELLSASQKGSTFALVLPLQTELGR